MQLLLLLLLILLFSVKMKNMLIVRIKSIFYTYFALKIHIFY